MMEVAGNTFLLLAISTCVIVYLWTQRWQKRGGIGPKEWPLIGSLFEVTANTHRIHDWSYEYMKKSPTGTVKFSVNGVRNIMVARPDNVEHMLKANFPNYIKGPFMAQRMKDLIGTGIFVADGDVWKQHRKIASFEFSSSNLRETSTDVYREHALHLLMFLDSVADSPKQVDIQDLFLRMTMDSSCKIGFGVDQHNLSTDLPEFARALDTLSLWTVARIFDVAWKLKKKFNLGREKKFRALLPVLDSFTYGVIRDRRLELARLYAMGKTLERRDLLSRFMSAKDENGEGLPDKVLRDAVLSFLVAGRDSTACTLAWFVHVLCHKPEVAEKCCQEMNVVLGMEDDNLGRGTDRFYKFANRLTYESLGKLHYIQAAISETLRLYPAIARDAKYAVNDDVLPDGTIVRRGDQVVYVPYVMGRLESLWGPDALEFRPERWLKDGYYQHESPFKFSAFQAGPRVCLGKDTAYLQMKMTVAVILRFLRFQEVPDQSVTYNVGLVMTIKHGLKVTVQHK